MKKYKVIITILILLICIFSLLNVPVIKKNYVNKNVESDKKEIELSINKWVEIPTYDKHNEVTHPKVLNLSWKSKWVSLLYGFNTLSQ